MTRRTKEPLADKLVVITGAGRGIGLATAKEAHRRGAFVVIADVDATAAKNAAAALGDRAYGTTVDVSDAGSVKELVTVAERIANVDALVNNAGIMPIGKFLDSAPDLYSRAVGINVLGCIFGAHAALPAMLRHGTGHIINVASTAGKAPVPGGAAYCATKAAVVAFTETLRVEYAKTGVSFTCVMPHFTNTDLVAGTTSSRGIPMVEPVDVANAICDAIENPKNDVYVPKIVGPILAAQPLLGRTVRDAVNRKLGAYNAFLDIDHEARAGYADRITHS